MECYSAGSSHIFEFMQQTILFNSTNKTINMFISIKKKSKFITLDLKFINPPYNFPDITNSYSKIPNMSVTLLLLFSRSFSLQHTQFLSYSTEWFFTIIRYFFQKFSTYIIIWTYVSWIRNSNVIMYNHTQKKKIPWFLSLCWLERKRVSNYQSSVCSVL